MSGEEKELSPLKQALLALTRMQSKLDAAERARREPIAIVGWGCRFPLGVESPDAFWDLLAKGGDAITEVPPERWNVDELYDPDPNARGKMNTRWGGFIRDVDRFDPQFFGMTPREAMSLDPQQRLLLEVVWEALESAGQAPDRLHGSSTGVYVGILSSDYGDLQLAGDGIDRIDTYFGSGTARSMASGRISYTLGLQGPSVSIDTACSSSLVALHLACQSLRSGETTLAIAAGVNLTLAPEPTIALSRFHMMASDGHCKTFDRRADGYVRGEACCALVLKPLSAALAAGDPVLAVIRGSAVNQDGASSGLTAPNGQAQEAVIRAALDNAGLTPDQVTYVETHGTGTSLGDPIEVQALARTLAASRPADRPLLVGAVKANVGHTEAAAGLTGVLKAALCLKHGQIPPQLHLSEPNPLIPWDRLAVQVPLELRQWPEGSPRVAGISSFGFSGTNAHVLLEAAPAVGEAVAPEPVEVLTLSARSEALLRQFAEVTAAAFSSMPADRWAGACHAANQGRAAHAHRLALLASDGSGAAAALRRFAAGEAAVPGLSTGVVRERDAPAVTFLFTGQGSQYAGMGRRLYETQPCFRDVIDRCETLFAQRGAPSILPMIQGVAGTDAADTRIAQPSLFALEAALAALWMSWGIKPDAVLGHSLGEYVAAHVAGILSLEDAVSLVAARARLMGALPTGGGMLAVMADESVVDRLLASIPGLSLAAANAPTGLVVSGALTDIARAGEWLQQAGVSSTRLQVSHAFHSALMDPVLDEFESVASGLRYDEPRIALVSNVTGDIARGLDARSAGYWRRHLRGTVRFAAGIQALARSGRRLFLELGPSPVLCGLGQRSVKDGTFLSALQRGVDDGTQSRDVLGRLFVHGVRADWNRVDAGRRIRSVALPTGGYERERCWIEPRSGTRATLREAVAPSLSLPHPLLSSQVDGPLEALQLRATLDPAAQAFIAEHRVQGRSLLPATAFIELAMAAARTASSGAETELLDLELRSAMPFEAGEKRLAQVTVSATGEGQWSLAIHSRTDGGRGSWVQHAACRATVSAPAAQASSLDRDAIVRRCTRSIDGRAHYDELERRGYDFGHVMRGVHQVRHGEGEYVAEIRAVASPQDSAFFFAPAQFDACLQCCWLLLPEGAASAYVPVAAERIVFHRAPTPTFWSHARVRQAGGGRMTVDIDVCTPQGERIASVHGLRFQALGASRSPLPSDWLYELQWEPRPLRHAGGDLRETDRSAISMAELGTLAGDALQSLVGEHALSRHAQTVAELERLSVLYIVRMLARWNLELRPGGTLTVERVIRAGGIDARHHRLLLRLLQILEEAGVSARAADGWRIVALPDYVSADTSLAALRAQSPEASAQLQLFERCVGNIARVMRGEAEALEILFEGGSLDLVETFYRSLPEGRVFNSATARVVAAAVERLPADRRVRILEVGAGTGSVSAPLLALLKPGRVDYTFTDVSTAFLARARDKLAAHGDVRYQIFDAERDAASQGFRVGTFDIVIAANALHATRRVDATLANVRGLLAPRGLLVLLEGTAPERWLDLTFGMTSGWWAFEDRELRPDHVLMSTAAWRSTIERSGFSASQAVRLGADLSHQSIVLAHADAANPAIPERRLLVSDSGLAQPLRSRLLALGESAEVIDWHEDGPSRETLARALASGDALRDVVLMLAPVGPGSDRSGEQNRLTAALLGVIQSLASAGRADSPTLTIVTQGAQATGTESRVDASSAALWGAGKVVDLEHPEFACRRIDLDPDVAAIDQLDALAIELQRQDSERLIAWRKAARYVTRLDSHLPADAAVIPIPEGPATRLLAAPSGILDEMRWSTAERTAPDADGIELEVTAVGVSFRDVMNALAVRNDGEGLGAECAGTVVRVGSAVVGFQPGDRVVALAAGSMRSFVTVPQSLALKLPAGLSEEQSVTLTTTAVTAWHSLVALAGLRAGESVLIHAAAGGVGLAAVSIAMSRGAIVHATAGSPAKRDYLRALGVRNVHGSRDIGFRDAVLAATSGRGVDVVLSALSGDLLAASVDCLAQGGRFVEIGKRDIWSTERMAARRPDCRYHVVDLAAEDAPTREALRQALVAVFDGVRSGAVRPLPQRYFRRDQAAEAFRHMAAARHVGKVVLGLTPSATGRCRSDGTYLVTGGSRGLGLLTAQWLAAQGAGTLVLLSRRPPEADALAAIERMRAGGTRVEVRQGDVGDGQFVRTVVDEIAATLSPLRGIVHAAGVLHDATFARQTPDRFAAVFRPKVDGAWHLHEMTADQPLEFFVLYSSLSGVLGAAGQANHAAANAVLDQLAHHRRSLGLPALSIDWGIWTEIGSAAERGADERAGSVGARTISPARGLQVLERLLDGTATQVAVMPTDWEAFLAQWRDAPPAWLERMRRSTSPTSPANASAEPAAASASLLTSLNDAAESQRRELAETFVAKQIADVIGFDARRHIDRQQPLGELGVDSMMAVELRNRLGARSGLKRALPATLVFDYPNVAAIAGLLLDLAGLSRPEPPVAEASRDEGDDLLAELEAMSDDAAENLVGREDASHGR